MIGVFDSGLGGLAILKKIRKALPRYAYVYLGDTARAPYGNRSLATIYRFTKEGVEFLVAEGCTLIIIACNTASAQALRRLQKEYLRTKPHIKILGVIVPAAEEAVEKSRNGRIGLIGTNATVKSGKYIREIGKISPSAKVFQKPTPLLTPLIEAGKSHSPEARRILKKYLEPLLEKDIDTLILACTHYEFVEKEVRAIIGKNIRLVAEGPVIAEKLKAYLKRHPEVEKPLRKKKNLVVYITGATERFKKLGSMFLGTAIHPHRVKMLK